ncbi:uncharacterized protein Z518_10575 [Rhinocladiella mackenziei CBS 650.93]|uniref:Transcription factor domain-containing protein n=1 Tax=Rhinocladiella mackenziei CBS 650.93 TaxID=1442369 RepID=A0A0D2IAY1_9EURO|nr:uncharacterized protein Z518_10575 [Rhinocladiella mackenziei CBS 650.93]KIX00436.1 hypothetical protein Z518_10575 [Rhinocladiella mackenziei CBS 650.93]
MPLPTTGSLPDCRRRKIKCNWPPPSDSNDGDDPSNSAAQAPQPASADTLKKCIECTTHRRTCEVQGYVDSNPGTSTVTSRSSKRIYKRRRGVGENSTSEGSCLHQDGRNRTTNSSIGDDDSDQPRMKIHVARMDPFVHRLARERELGLDLQCAKPREPMPTVNGDNAPGLEARISSDKSLRDQTQAPEQESKGNGTGSGLPVEDQARKLSPLLSQLFSNEMLTQISFAPNGTLSHKVQRLTFTPNPNSSTTSATLASDVDKLNSTISSEPYLLKVLDISVHWWISWRDQPFALHEALFDPLGLPSPPRSGSGSGSTSSNTTNTNTSSSPGSRSQQGSPQILSLHDFVRLKLSRSDDAISVATGLLCIAMCLQQLRPGVDDSDLYITTSPTELSERIVLAIDTILLSPTSNPAYMRDPNILLLLMMRSKMFAESNQLRKSWLTVRKAIAVAQNIGFTDPPISEEGATRVFHRRRFLGSILEINRLMSMVLGFPHVEDDKFTDHLALAVLRGQVTIQNAELNPRVSADIQMRALRRIVAIAAGRINDRNASGDPDDFKLQTTMAIQATLNEAAAAMPSSWWDAQTHLQGSDPRVSHEHLIAQMWFWQVQAFLHLPFMLRPNPHHAVGLPTGCEDDDLSYSGHGNAPYDPYEMNRYLCLQGCRGMIRAFNIVRSDPSLAVYICACEDFQGVLTSCILMVGLLIRLSFYPAAAHPLPPLTSMDDPASDLALIEEIKDIFRYRALQQGGCISKQGLEVLEELGSFLDDGDFVSSGGDGCEPQTWEPQRRTVILPYFGAIHLELRPPRHFRGRKLGIAVPAPPFGPDPLFEQPLPRPPGSTEQPPLQGTFGTTSPYPEGHQGSGETQAPGQPAGWSACEEFTFQMPVYEENTNWDQFLYGDELGRNWNVDSNALSEWPVDEGTWEWS